MTSVPGPWLIREFTTKDARTGAFLKRRTETTVEALAARQDKELAPLRLQELLERPELS